MILSQSPRIGYRRLGRLLERELSALLDMQQAHDLRKVELEPGDKVRAEVQTAA